MVGKLVGKCATVRSKRKRFDNVIFYVDRKWSELLAILVLAEWNIIAVLIFLTLKLCSS